MRGEPIELKLSDSTTVVVAELDGWESRQADLVLAGLINITPEQIKAGKIPAMEMATLQNGIYSVCSVRKINGVDFDPRHSVQLHKTTTAKFSIPELAVLEKWGSALYTPADDKVKKEPEPQPSES